MSQYFTEKSKAFAKLMKKNFFIKSTSQAFSSLSQLTFLASVSCLLAWISPIFALPSRIIFDFFSLFVAAAVAYNTVKNIKGNFLPVLVSVISFCVLLPEQPTLSWFGLSGYFTALFVGFLSVKIYARLSAFDPDIKLPGNVPSFILKEYIDYIAPIGTVLVFIILRFLFYFTPEGHILYYVLIYIQQPILSVANSPFMFVFVLLLIQILWYHGIHGAITVMPLYVPLFVALSMENLTLIRDGFAPVNVMNTAFFWVYSFPGGAGATLSLAILMYFFSRSKKIREITEGTFLSNFFTVNETIIMGLPIAHNKKIAFPFIFVPLINASLAAIFTYMGILPILNGIYLPFTTPFFIYGFVNGGLPVVIFQCVLILLDLLIYLPFFKSIDKEFVKSKENNI